MKQSTLLGSFTRAEKLNHKAAELSRDCQNSEKEKEPQTKTSHMKFNNNTTHQNKSGISPLNEIGNEKQKELSVTPATAESKSKVKTRKNASKLSLSGKHKNESIAQGNGMSVNSVNDKEVVVHNDFSAQNTQASQFHDSNASKKARKSVSRQDSAEIVSEKPTMSYTDFLNLFKPAPVHNTTDNDISLNTNNIDCSCDNTEPLPPPVTQCRSILSFFSKSTCTGSQNESGKSNPTTVSVVAEVHQVERTNNSRLPSSPLKQEKQVNLKKIPENVDAIEYLGSETVEEAENAADSPVKSKKRKNKHENTMIEQSKKQKILDVNDEKDNNMSMSYLGHKNYEKSAEELTQTVGKITQISNKTSQSQLCLSKNGLALSKSAVETKMESVVTEKKPQRVSSSNSKTSSTLNLTDSPECSSAPVSVRTKEYKAVDQGAESEKLPPETTSLRRSSRIARPVKPFMIHEVVSVDDDDEQEEEKDGKKRQDEQMQRKKSQQMHVVPGSPRKKMKVPLAPIFTSRKSVEEEQPSQMDSEKVRLRKEFMMSGIPEELKRQIASNSSSIALDYPPYPKPSHIQQLSKDSCNFDSKSILTVTCKEEQQTLKMKDNVWKSLDWDATVASDFARFFRPFQDLSTLSESQQNKLMSRWQQMDASFNFKKVFDRLVTHSKVPPGTDETSGLQKPASTLKAKLGSSEDVDIVIIDETSPVVSKAEEVPKKVSVDPYACLWSDLHQPQNSEEVVGNLATLEQLKDWLGEWKKVVQKDLKKACKKSSQPIKSKGKGYWSDDSDFTDSEEEENSLCNTMLIIGPHGVGKTASVYALAEEMGYKVFEVNSSTLRSGKQILSQLEEATQSHRVAPSRLQACPLQDMTPTGRTKSEEAEHLKGKKSNATKSVASAFAALFGQPAEKCSSIRKHKKKSDKNLQKSEIEETQFAITAKKESKDEKYSASRGHTHRAEKRFAKTSRKTANKAELTASEELKPCIGSKNLTTTSLILFDEVDVVFEEDKGFLATIEHFMASTKIPIILTSTDPLFSLQLGARHDQIVFKRPPLISSVSFLCCVCLAHGIAVARRTMEELLQLLKFDLRRCLLYLQFWCQSQGGSRYNNKLAFSSESVSSQINSKSTASDFEVGTSSKESDNILAQSKMDSSWDTYDDDSNSKQFLSLRPSKRKSYKIIEDTDDENSNSSHQLLEIEQDLIKHEKIARKQIELSHEEEKLIKKAIDDTTSSKTISVEACFTGRVASPLSSVKSDIHFDCEIDFKNSGKQNINSGSDISLHLGLAESFLGLKDVRLSSQTIISFIQ
ncbi:ATPase family aaa domain-containing protein 5, partial [Plakobranchus ocellatus]